MNYTNTLENVRIPVEIFEWELEFIEKRLKELPRVRVVRRVQRGKTYEVARWIDKSGRTRELRTSRISDSMNNLIKTRANLKTRRTIVLNSILKSQNESRKNHSLVNVTAVMDGKFFESAVDRCLPPPPDKKYELNGYFMRSRAELNIGMALNSLGLPFKYEVRISDLGDAVDFLVYIPSLDCCFILEYFGVGNDYKYINKTANKLSCSFQSRYRLFYEYAFLAGTEDSVPSYQVISTLIAMVVSNLCQERMRFE